MSQLTIAIVGCGYWGNNLLRNFSELDNVRVSTACDSDMGKLIRVRRRYPSVDLKTDCDDIIDDPSIDGIVIATPVSSHYSIARRALEANKHVLVEKPLATSSEQVLDLIELSEQRGKTLMVDHTFLYTGAVRCMKSLVTSGEIGKLLYFDSVRISLGLVQSDINVLWDLAPHDFSILNFLCDRDPVAISATGTKHLGCPFENIAYVSAHFDDDVIAHFHVNWLAPVKVRRTLVGGSRKMIVYDDMESSEKVKVYDKGFSVNHDPGHRERLLTGYRNGDMHAPNLDTAEALRLMAKDFVGAIVEGRRPTSDGYAGYRVVRMLEVAAASMEQHGRPVELRSSRASFREAVSLGQEFDTIGVLV